LPLEIDEYWRRKEQTLARGGREARKKMLARGGEGHMPLHPAFKGAAQGEGPGCADEGSRRRGTSTGWVKNNM